MIKFDKTVVVGTLLASAVFVGCNSNTFKVSGKIEGAKDKSVIVERPDYNGQWIAVDSTRTSSSGDFSINIAAPGAPEVYRLVLDGKYIYFPIDSLDNVSVKTSLKEFGKEWTLTGSDNAVMMEKFEKEANKLLSADKDSVARFKRKVFTEIILPSQASIMSYYVLTKTLGDTPLYDIEDQQDAKYFGAVATAYGQLKPNDPHTKLLEQTSLDAMRRRNAAKGKQRVIEANEVAMFEIDLQDKTGKHRRLSDVLKEGKATIVAFSMLTHEDSPAINQELAKIYNSHSGGINIYEVCVDPDQYSWKEAASNLPWVAVYQSPDTAGDLLSKYNVSQLPVFYIYDRNGEIAGRADTMAELKSEISRF